MITLGLHRIPAADYHADPCDMPSLSASMIHTLLTYSPRHAWMAHPRLNPKFEREHSSRFDIGSAAHAMLLGDDAQFVIVDADDWRTKAAKDERDAAYAAGKIPLLSAQYETTREMVAEARAQFAAHEMGNPFVNGSPEVTLVWQERDVQCRSLLDWMPDDHRNVLIDYKTVDGSANPEGLQSRLISTGADIQAAFYSRGFAFHFGRRPRFLFVCQEIAPPYALSVVEFDSGAMVIADKKIDEALELWARCLRDNRWPGYPARVATIGAPSWYESRQIEREMRGEMDRQAKVDSFVKLLNWQSPEGKPE